MLNLPPSLIGKEEQPSLGDAASGPGQPLQSSAADGERISAHVPIAPPHTPGPWYAQNYGEHGYDVFAKDEGSTYVANVNYENEHLEGNARLIAAAPELLEQLTNLVGLAKMGAAKLHNYPAAIAEAETAVAKATQP